LIIIAAAAAFILTLFRAFSFQALRYADAISLLPLSFRRFELPLSKMLKLILAPMSAAIYAVTDYRLRHIAICRQRRSPITPADYATL
jgi:hypothetical protein